LSYLLGIDVGTTRTAAAIARLGGLPGETEIINLGDRASAVPSVLYVDDDGTIVVGEAAERRAVTDPDHVAREFKRRIGDPTPVVVGGRPWAPEELSARLVRWVVDRVTQREGGHPARIAVTHPASWGGHKKERFGSALAARGIPVTFLAEPQAAALHYAAAERVEPGSTIAVYDFGGGTFDAAVVHKDGQAFSLLGRPEGVERLGGIDFDEVVFEHVLQGLPEAFEGLDENDPAVLSAVARIRRECTEAKEALSSDTEVAIPVFTPAGQGSVRLHRSEFEAAIRPQVEETVDALRNAVASAGLVPAQLSAVLLVGGSSRIPLVGQLVSERLGRPVAVDADPKNAIAMGAVLSLTQMGTTGNGPMAPQVPAPRVGGSARFPVTAAAPPFGAAPFGAAAGAQMSSGMPPVPGQQGSGGYAPSSTGTPRPGAYDSGPTSVAAPPTQRMGGASGGRAGVLPPPPPPTPRPGYDYVPEPAPGGRSPAWLVTVGGAAAAVAVIAAAFLLPSNSPVRASAATPVGNPSAPSQVVQQPNQDPTGDPSTPETTRGSRPTPLQPTRPAAPPATTAPQPTTTPPPVATTTPPAETTIPPTTESTPPTTEPQPPTTDPGAGQQGPPGAASGGGHRAPPL
jgi:molecular chaperone DnaK